MQHTFFSVRFQWLRIYPRNPGENELLVTYSFPLS